MTTHHQPLITGPAKSLESMEDLIDELSLGSARGGAKRGTPVSIQAVRPLTPEDLDAVRNAPPVGALPSIPEIRHQHHQLAGLLARGISNAEISLITGYSPSYISILRNAPDMQELISYYAAQVEERTVDAAVRLRNLGIAAVEEQQRRISEAPEAMTHGQLQDLIEVGLIKPAGVAALAAGGAGKGAGNGIQINLNFKAPASGGSDGAPIIDVTASGGEDS